ncbi:MAG: hypothetical protein LBH68_07505 [Bifidobacteriaceae bacterium]|jgi:hypothetical protein|nr:hypothetical protein [Bifidobacteriaceae bacterium]
MNDHFDRLYHRPSFDSLDKAAAWEHAQRNFEELPAPSQLGRRRGTVVAAGLVAVAAVAATAVLVTLAADPGASTGPDWPGGGAASDGGDVGITVEDSGALDALDLPLLQTDCGYPAGTTAEELTIADVQTSLTCALMAMERSDLVVSTEIPAEKTRWDWSEQITAPAGGGYMLVSQEAAEWSRWAGDSTDYLFATENGELAVTTWDHVQQTYNTSYPDDHFDTVVMDSNELGWMGQLAEHWEAVQFLMVMAADPANAGELTLLGMDYQDGQEVLKLQLEAPVLPHGYLLGGATSAELWLYLDSGLPARLAFTYDLASVTTINLESIEGDVDVAGAAWCYDDAAEPVTDGPCVDSPVLYRWYTSDYPAEDFALPTPVGYTESTQSGALEGFEPGQGKGGMTLTCGAYSVMVSYDKGSFYVPHFVLARAVACTDGEAVWLEPADDQRRSSEEG